MGSSAIEWWRKIYLHGVDMRGIKIKIDYNSAFLYDIKRINMGLFSVETLERSFAVKTVEN